MPTSAHLWSLKSKEMLHKEGQMPVGSYWRGEQFFCRKTGGDDRPLWRRLLPPRPRRPVCAPPPSSADRYVGSMVTILTSGSLFSLFPLQTQFNLLTSVLISLCRLFADFTRHNFYQLALKRGITNWGLLPVLERGAVPAGPPTLAVH